MVPQTSLSRTPKSTLPEELPADSHNTEVKQNIKQTRSRTFNLTPESSVESINRPSRKGKKVNWPDNDGDRNSSPVVEINREALQASASAERKPIKSILKPNHAAALGSFDPAPAKLFPPHTYPNLAAMLESILQQLERGERSSKVDAYNTLAGSIKASDNVPEVRALRDRMSILLKFMRRDLTAKLDNGTWDSQLITNVLILTSSFLSRPAIAEVLSLDFCAYLVDHAIKSLQDTTTSKEIVKHLMFNLATQKFPPKILTADRVTKLITSLDGVEQLAKGNSVITGKFDVYKNLLRTSKQHMLGDLSWIDDLLATMLSSISSVRVQAIEFGLEAGLVFGVNLKVSRYVESFFQGESTEYEITLKYGDYFVGRLKEFLDKKNGKAERDVPRIWTVVVLFLRCRPKQIEGWIFWQDWTQLLQTCFNSSDLQTRLEANTAWARLAFALHSHEKAPEESVGLLRRPLLAQLKRKSVTVNFLKGRKSVFSSICILLYYALRPNSPHSQLDRYWDAYIVECVGKTLLPAGIIQNPELARQDLVDACKILASLFDSTTPRPWKETRAMELGPLEAAMDFSELPALDSKWLRKSSTKVFPLLFPIIDKLFWDLTDENEQVTLVFKNYITSIASPSIKEIKVPNEAMSCVAAIFTMLYQIWLMGPESITSLAPSNGSVKRSFIGSFRVLILTAIKGLGQLPFTEKRLSAANGRQTTFEVTATPSHRPDRMAHEQTYSPLHHLFILLTTECPGLSYNEEFYTLALEILKPFFESRTNFKARMDFINELVPLIPIKTNEPSRLIWPILADFTTQTMCERDSNGASGTNDTPLRAQYRDAIKILEVGIRIFPTDISPSWKSLFETLISFSTKDAGDSCRAIAVIEPLAQAVFNIYTAKYNNKKTVVTAAYCTMLVENATYPKDDKTISAVKRKLWGITEDRIKPTGRDPYIHLYEIVILCLGTALTSGNASESVDSTGIVCASASLIERNPLSEPSQILDKISEAIFNYSLTARLELGIDTPVSQAIRTVWDQISSRHPASTHSKLRDRLQVLLCTGLESGDENLVSSSIRLWNSTFATFKESLQYVPEVVEKILRLRPASSRKLVLPYFPEVLEHEDLPSAPNSMKSVKIHAPISGTPSPLFATPKSRKLQRDSTKNPSLKNFTVEVRLEASRSTSPKRLRGATPDHSKRKPSKRISTHKLRHDDSQIHFAAIESSPAASTVPDFQLLTEHQKEVKERQVADVAMFPDLRSSPLPRPTSVSRTSSASKRATLSSKTRAAGLIIPIDTRQITPTPQAESDAFIMSSPTPNRSGKSNLKALGPPSSSPEVVKDEYSPISLIPGDLPSSPPVPVSKPDPKTMSSTGPSAQVDPTIRRINYRTSVFEFTPDETNGPEAEVTDGGNRGSQADRCQSQTPSTPERRRQHRSDIFTPKAPVFHDAVEELALPSSESHEDFLDAASSPSLLLDRDDSSQLSELDQSSVMRLMAGYDQGSSRAPKTVSSASNNLIQDAETNENSTNKDNDVHLSSVIGDGTSSFASLIPETQGEAAQSEGLVSEEWHSPLHTTAMDVSEAFIIDEKDSKRRRKSPKKVSQKKRRSSSRLEEAPLKKAKIIQDTSNQHESSRELRSKRQAAATSLQQEAYLPSVKANRSLNIRESFDHEIEGLDAPRNGHASTLADCVVTIDEMEGIVKDSTRIPTRTSDTDRLSTSAAELESDFAIGQNLGTNAISPSGFHTPETNIGLEKALELPSHPGALLPVDSVQTEDPARVSSPSPRTERSDIVVVSLPQIEKPSQITHSAAQTEVAIEPVTLQRVKDMLQSYVEQADLSKDNISDFEGMCMDYFYHARRRREMLNP